MRLLEQFVHGKPELALGELSAGSGLPRATAHRFLVTLRDLGFVQYDAQTQRYRLGFKLLELGYLVKDQIELRSVAKPHMERLRDMTGDTVHLQIVDGDEGVYVEKVEAREGFRMWTRVGMRRPLHAGCSMKVLLAYLPPDRTARILAQPLERYTDLTVTDPAVLVRELEDIRKQGYAVSFGESHPHVTGIAAPIWDSSQEVVASISLLGPSDRFPRERIERLIPEVVKSAGDISSELGFPRPPVPSVFGGPRAGGSA